MALEKRNSGIDLIGYIPWGIFPSPCDANVLVDFLAYLSLGV
jgi:hypothetical protein